MGAQSAELQASWPRGPNENTNCLFRQYFFTGTDFLRYSRAHLNKAAHHLNERSRKTLEFETRRSGVTPVLHRPVEITAISRLTQRKKKPAEAGSWVKVDPNHNCSTIAHLFYKCRVLSVPK